MPDWLWTTFAIIGIFTTVATVAMLCLAVAEAYRHGWL